MAVARNRKKADIRFVVCRDGVDLKSHEYRENRLVEQRLARGFEFAIDQATGKIHRTGTGDTRFLAASGTANGWDSNRRRPPVPIARWPRSRWNGNTRGSTLRENAGEYEGSGDDISRPRPRCVRAGFAIGADDRRRTSSDRRRQSSPGRGLDAVQHAAAHPASGDEETAAYIEMAATENAELEGRSFTRWPTAITYDQSKGLYILTGDGNRDAQIWRESGPGAQRASQTGQR